MTCEAANTRMLKRMIALPTLMAFVSLMGGATVSETSEASVGLNVTTPCEAPLCNNHNGSTPVEDTFTLTPSNSLFTATSETWTFDNSTVDSPRTLSEHGAMVAQSLWPFFAPVGVLLNLITVAVSTMGNNGFSSCWVYLAAIAAVDSCLLLVLFIHWAMLVSLEGIAASACVGLTYTTSVFQMCGSFLVTAVCVDRALAVTFPMAYFSHRTPKRALIVCISLSLSCFFINVPQLLHTGAAMDAACNIIGCTGSFSLALTWFHATIQVLAPLPFILCVDILIIEKLVSCRSFRYFPGRVADSHPMRTRTQPCHFRWEKEEIPAEDRSLAIMVLVMNLVYLALMMPETVRNVMICYSDGDDVIASHGDDKVIVPVKLSSLLAATLKFMVYCSCADFRKHSKGLLRAASGWTYYYTCARMRS